MSKSKTPLRKCVVTQEMLPKSELMRVVKSKDGIVEIDETGKKSGRGAYVKRSVEVIQEAKKRKALEKSLRVGLSDDFYDILIGCV